MFGLRAFPKFAVDGVTLDMGDRRPATRPCDTTDDVGSVYPTSPMRFNDATMGGTCFLRFQNLA
jgi:hypothetical protein